MQEERSLGRLRPDMDVCDRNGDKLGTIAHVYRHEVAAATGVPGAELTPPAEDVIEVKTGLFGLGKHLYVPVSAVTDTTTDAVFLSRSRDELAELGWERKPDYLTTPR